MSDNRDGMAFWTDERIERLGALWAEGLSASKIAKELGGVTRNAVIGKIRRLGLSNTRARMRGRPPRVHNDRFVPRIRAVNLPQGTEGFNELTYEEPKQQPVAFVDLERHHCRWPVTVHDFCGVQALDGKSYCGYHQKVATRR